MRRLIRLIAFACALCVLAVCVADVIAASPSKLDRRVLGRLTAKSEVIRQQATMELQQTAKTKYRYLAELIEAVKLNCEQLDSENGDRDDWASSMPPISVIGQMYLIGSTDRPEAQECLVKLLQSSHAGVSMIAADVLGKNKYVDSIDAIAKQKSDPQFAKRYGYRFNLVRSLAQMEHPQAIETLTSWRSSFDGQLRHEIDELLSKVTEKDFGDDKQRYDAWKIAMSLPSTTSSALQEDGEEGVMAELDPDQPQIVLQPSSVSSDSLDRLKLSKKRQYYGMELHAKRLMFIIDHSGSMEAYSQGMTRLQRAKIELIRVITDLDPDTEFAIMFYETVVRTWRERLVIASDENKLEAIQFIKRLKYGDRTNTYTALRNAIEYSDDLEAVYLLTDGQPTEGPIIAPPAIVLDILHRNRFRHLNFNTIGVAVSGPTETFLKTLASESGGEFRALN
jgi:hypothetical protein